MLIDRDQGFQSLSASLSTNAQQLGRVEDGTTIPTGTAKILDMATESSIRWVGVLRAPPLPTEGSPLAVGRLPCAVTGYKVPKATFGVKDQHSTCR